MTLQSAVPTAGTMRWHVAFSETPRDEPLCLALANTVEWRRGVRPRDRLGTVTDLLRFACAEALIDDETCDVLQHTASRQEAAARAELDATRGLREAAFAVFSAHAEQREPALEHLARISDAFDMAMSALQLELREHELVPRFRHDARPFDVVRSASAISAVALLTGHQIERVKSCADDRGCARLFLDLTRNGSRRFCASRECGNRARQAAFRARHRAALHDQGRA